MMFKVSTSYKLQMGNAQIVSSTFSQTAACPYHGLILIGSVCQKMPTREHFLDIFYFPLILMEKKILNQNTSFRFERIMDINDTLNYNLSKIR